MPSRLSPFLLVLACCAAESDDEPRGGVATDRPNVLIVISDDLASIATGTWGPGGEGLVPTPGIDALARRGVVFERALCASPFCTPSRQSFLTGRWPHAIRVTQLKSTLPKDAPTLGTVFRDAGYRTAAIGKMHWMRTRVGEVEFGFDRIAGKIEWQDQLTPEERSVLDEYNRGWSRAERKGWSMSNPEGAPLPLEEKSHMAPFLLEETKAFMEEDGTRPFLAFLSLGEPHAPFHFPPRLLESVDPGTLPLPQVDEALQSREVLGLAAMLKSRRALKGPLTEDILRGALAAYLRSVLWMDEQLVALDRYLEASGRWENTIVIFWSDNGYLLGERGHLGKNYPYREVVQVPLSIASPGVAPARTGELAHAIDVFPTLCALCGIEPPAYRAPDALRNPGSRSGLQRVRGTDGHPGNRALEVAPGRPGKCRLGSALRLADRPRRNRQPYRRGGLETDSGRPGLSHAGLACRHTPRWGGWRVMDLLLPGRERGRGHPCHSARPVPGRVLTPRRRAPTRQALETADAPLHTSPWCVSSNAPPPPCGSGSDVASGVAPCRVNVNEGPPH